MTAPQEARLSCSVIGCAIALAESRTELVRLAETPGAACSIVQHPDWLAFELAWRGPTTMLHLVLASNGLGQVIGYAPFLAEAVHNVRLSLGSRRVLLYRGKVLRMLGDGVVALPADRELAEQLIAGALQRDGDIRVVRIQESDLPNSLARAMGQGQRPFATVSMNLVEQVARSIAPQASSAAYLAQLDGKRRNDLTRRLRNVYKKLGGQTVLRIFNEPDQVVEYTALMNRVYARSWHAEVLPIDWEMPERRALFRRLAEDRHWIGHLLMRGERPVAYVHGYILGARYVLDDTGYDEEFASLGIGSALVFETVLDLLDRYPGVTIDFGYGDNQYKRVLADRQRECGSLYLARGMWPRLGLSMVSLVRWGYRQAKRWR